MVFEVLSPSIYLFRAHPPRFDDFVPLPSASHDGWEFLSKKTGIRLTLGYHFLVL